MNPLNPRPELYGLPFRTHDFHGMPYRYLGKSGLRASDVGLGTWRFGLPETRDGSKVDEKTAFAIFDRAVELGVTFWDTANRYNDSSGNSERVIGRWLKNNSDQRRNIVIGTKCAGNMDGMSPNHNGLSRANILDSVYASLERLQTDHIDLLYFHQPDERTPIEESLAAVEDLIRQDAVRYFAVSNYTVEQLDAYREASKAFSARCRMIAVQNRFDLLNGEAPERAGVLANAAANGLSFIAWSPLGGGLLRGSRPEAAPKENTDESNRCTLALEKLAESWGMQLPQLALAYMLTLPGMGPVIPSVSSVRQLEGNAAAGRIRLDDDQIRLIREVLRDDDGKQS